MGLLLLKKISLFVLLISSSFLSTSFAGRQIYYLNGSAVKEKLAKKSSYSKEGATRIHERLLRVNTKDYGRYDPAPALVKPPFKLIPN